MSLAAVIGILLNLFIPEDKDYVAEKVAADNEKYVQKSELKALKAEIKNELKAELKNELKSELYYIKEKEYKNIEELEKDIIEYIEYYNNRRIKSKLKGMSPVQYRQHSILVA